MNEILLQVTSNLKQLLMKGYIPMEEWEALGFSFLNLDDYS